jgi:hypothetical protein
MTNADLCRQKACHCRQLAKAMDERTAASLEMLATAYDQDARLADIEEAGPRMRGH